MTKNRHLKTFNIRKWLKSQSHLTLSQLKVVFILLSWSGFFLWSMNFFILRIHRYIQCCISSRQVRFIFSRQPKDAHVLHNALVVFCGATNLMQFQLSIFNFRKWATEWPNLPLYHKSVTNVTNVMVNAIYELTSDTICLTREEMISLIYVV